MPIGPSTHAIGTHAIYSPLQQYLNCVVVSILAFHARDPGSIPPWSYNLSYFIFFPSHPPGVTKPSSSSAQRGAYLLLQVLTFYQCARSNA